MRNCEHAIMPCTDMHVHALPTHVLRVNPEGSSLVACQEGILPLRLSVDNTARVRQSSLLTAGFIRTPASQVKQKML